MRRLFVLVAALVLPVGIAACGDDGGGSGSGSGSTDEATDEEAISLDEWVEQADETCAANDDEVAELESPDFDPTGDLSDEQLEEAADFWEELAGLQQELLDQLREIPPPDEDADEASDTLDIVQGAVDDLNAAVDAARDGDVDAYNEDLENAFDGFDDASAAAADLGLEVCGEEDSDNTGSTGNPTGDDTGV
jgi:hypothetical protein